MSSRIFLILLGGIVISATLTLGFAMSERQEMIRDFRYAQAAERVSQFLLSFERVSPALRPELARAAVGVGIDIRPAGQAREREADEGSLAAAVDQRLPGGFRVAAAEPGPGLCPPPFDEGRRGDGRLPCEPLLVQLPDGDRLLLVSRPPRPAGRMRPRARPDFTVQAILFILSIGVLAAFIARMATAPVKRLAQAATALGGDMERPPLPEAGATEIRQAAAAFNAMQSRIRRHIRQQTHMLAAITHDLQTPLTRMRLRLEKVGDEELRGKLLGDLSAMQGMVREGLDLARSLDASEPVQRLDLDSLVDSVCTDASDAGQAVSFSGSTGMSLPGRPLALRRCLTNLVDNAAKYGRRADVTVQRGPGVVLVSVRDHGPGIPEDQLEKVFDPFYRLETSRSRDTGGTGLGLAIARNIAEQHGGKIELRNRADGGLEAILTLPC
ncbi:ATP-binding protein [Noviherbaspirillum humi]|nr:ATP-binding protein [Noviherbaspirillum humi]